MIRMILLPPAFGIRTGLFTAMCEACTKRKSHLFPSNILRFRVEGPILAGTGRNRIDFRNHQTPNVTWPHTYPPELYL